MASGGHSRGPPGLVNLSTTPRLQHSPAVPFVGGIWCGCYLECAAPTVALVVGGVLVMLSYVLVRVTG